MSAPRQTALTVVGARTTAERIQALQAEVRDLAIEHIAELLQRMVMVEQTAGEIASGGEAYPAGIRDMARRAAEDAEIRAGTICALLARMSLS